MVKWLRSAILILTLSGAIFSCSYSVHSVYQQFQPSYQAQIDKNRRTIDFLRETVVEIAATETGPQAIRDFLLRSVASGQINFFALKAPDGSWQISGLPHEEVAFLPKACGEKYVSENGVLQLEQACPDGIQVVMGFRTGEVEYWKRYFAIALPQLTKDILTSIALILAVLFAAFADHRALKRISEKKNAHRGDHSAVFFSESQHLVTDIDALETSNLILKNKIHLLTSQVSPSVQRLLAAGREFPYSLPSAVVRTDINQFSDIVNSKVNSAVEFSAFKIFVDEFFDRSGEIIGRYRGLVHDFVGDEIIYYFEDNVDRTASREAIAAIEEIHSIAADINKKTISSLGVPFAVKSAIAWGELIVGPKIEPLQIGGKSLIESVRFLSSLEGSMKFGGPIVYNHVVHEKLNGTVEDEMIFEKELKGIGAQKIYRVRQVPALSSVLSATSSDIFKQLRFYRSDHHVVSLMNYLSTNLRHLPYDRTQIILGHLNSIFLTYPSRDILESYLLLLHQAKKFFSAGEQNGAMVLSSVVSLAIRMVSKDFFGDRLKRELDDELFSQEPRLAAGVISVLNELDPNTESVVTIGAERSSSHRLAANALIMLSRKVNTAREWKKVVGKPLQAMLCSNNNNRRASALFAIGEIAINMRIEDSIWFNGNELLQRLIANIPNNCKSLDAMVRRQALSALKKVGREDEIAKVLRDTSLSSLNREEIESFLRENENLDYIKLRMDRTLRVH